jgi:predicted transcriptional regulator
MEQILIQIGELGLISGIIEIKDDENHIFKIVQLKPYDVSVDEIKLLRFAIRLKSFSMADVMESLSWNQSKVEKILQTMTNNGLLRHSQSYLQGDKWYILM